MVEMLKSLFFSALFLFHPVHVTLTSIDYIPETGSFSVFVRMYFDDFLRDYDLDWEEMQGEDFSADSTSSWNAMTKYIGKRIVIKVNGKELSGRLLKMGIADNEVSMDITYDVGETPGEVLVKNMIMTGLYSDQANMLIVRINDFEEGVKLTADVPEQTFTVK